MMHFVFFLSLNMRLPFHRFMQIDFHGQFLAVLPYVKEPNRPQRTVMMTDQEDDDDMT